MSFVLPNGLVPIAHACAPPNYVADYWRLLGAGPLYNQTTITATVVFFRLRIPFYQAVLSWNFSLFLFASCFT